MTVRNYSTTPASNNSAPPNGWPEGQAASTVNDCARQMMAEVRESFEELPYFDYGNTPTRVDNDTFTVSGDLTARYAVGYRVKLVGATTGYGRITVSSFGAGTTTIDVVMDSGNVPTSLARVAVNNSAALGVGSATPGAVTLSASVGTRTLASREDHVHALDQTIAPTMTATWTFTKAGGTPTVSAIYLNSIAPGIGMRESAAAADNRLWDNLAFSEQLIFRAVNDAENSTGNWMTVDRTGVTIDAVTLPTDGAGGIGGKFRVGTNNSSSGLSNVLMQVRSTTAQTTVSCRNSNSANFPLAIHNEATSGDNAFILFSTEAGATTRGSIDYNRAGTATRYNTTSDGRLKRNVKPAGSALQVALSIPVDEFDWIEGNAHVEHGFVAQKLYEVFPDAVSGGDDPEKVMGIDRAALVPVLCKALQETIQNVAALTARVAALESRR